MGTESRVLDTPVGRFATNYLTAPAAPETAAQQLNLGEPSTTAFRAVLGTEIRADALQHVASAFFSAIPSFPALRELGEVSRESTELVKLAQEVRDLRSTVSALARRLTIIEQSEPEEPRNQLIRDEIGRWVSEVGIRIPEVITLFRECFNAEQPEIAMTVNLDGMTDFPITFVIDCTQSDAEKVGAARANGGRARFYSGLLAFLPSHILDNVGFKFRFPHEYPR